MMCSKYLEDDEAAMQLRLMRTLSGAGAGASGSGSGVVGQPLSMSF
jgi:hypothetical protein